MTNTQGKRRTTPISKTVEQLYVRRGRRYLPVDDRRVHDFDRFPAEGVWLVIQQFGMTETARIASLERPNGESGRLEYALHLNGEVRQVADVLPVMQFAQLWPLMQRLCDALKEHEQERWRMYQSKGRFEERLSQFAAHVVETLASQLLDEKERWRRTGNEVELVREQMPFEDVLQLVDIGIRLNDLSNSATDRAEILQELRPFLKGEDGEDAKEPFAFLLEQLCQVWMWARCVEETLREWEPVRDLVKSDPAFRHLWRHGARAPDIIFSLLSKFACEWHARHPLEQEEGQAQAAYNPLL